MDELLEAIRIAVTENATAEQKASGAKACRTILIALEAEPGKPFILAGAPSPNPLGAIDPPQALDLVIARLRAALPAEDPAVATVRRPGPPGLRIALVRPPPGPSRRKR